MKLLEIQKLCKTYGSGETAVQALKNVSFSVQRGEYVAIVGESGSGKSTLLNMIGALDTPTSGKVLIDGRDTFSMKDKKRTIFRRRNIGFIFQAFNLIPELTVEQNIIFPLLLDYQKPESQRAAKPSAKPVVRRAAAAGGNRTRTDYPSVADSRGRADRKSRHAKQQGSDCTPERDIKKI